MSWKNSGMPLLQPPVEPQVQGASSSIWPPRTILRSGPEARICWYCWVSLRICRTQVLHYKSPCLCQFNQSGIATQCQPLSTCNLLPRLVLDFTVIYDFIRRQGCRPALCFECTLKVRATRSNCASLRSTHHAAYDDESNQHHHCSHHRDFNFDEWAQLSWRVKSLL